MDITVHPYIQANFTVPVDEGCNPFDVVINNASVHGDIFHWDFGDGSDTITFNTDPINHRFINTDYNNQQTYEITLVAENLAAAPTKSAGVSPWSPTLMRPYRPPGAGMSSADR